MRTPIYCQVKDIANWIRIDINANTDPTKDMVEEYILDNEDRMDRLTGHTWLPDRQAVEEFNVNKLYDWGRGMPLFPRHRNLKSFSPSAGDKFEIWNGSSWANLEQDESNGGQIYFQEIKGITYLRGFLFTILRVNRFRVTYRYGGNNDNILSETEPVPRDIKKACKLMTVLDLLGTDFQMSQVAYGGEGNVDKQKVMDRWQKEVDNIIWSHSEIISTW